MATEHRIATKKGPVYDALIIKVRVQSIMTRESEGSVHDKQGNYAVCCTFVCEQLSTVVLRDLSLSLLCPSGQR